MDYAARVREEASLESVLEVYLAATRDTAGAPSLLDMVVVADPIVQLDLLVLVLMAVGCAAITVQKGLAFRRASSSSRAFVDAFWKSRHIDEAYAEAGNYGDSPVAKVFVAGYNELRRAGASRGLDPESNVERALRRAASFEATRLETALPLLATTGATAPFIGLFGTVWGILQAFLKLGEPGVTATLQVVGPDIAHALVATAVGLVAAIPAVMAYNLFNARLHVLRTEMDHFTADFLNLVKRSGPGGPK